MNWIENVSIHIARQLKANGSPHSVGELSHGIEIMMLNLLNTSTLLILAIVSGCFTEVAAASFSYIIIRNFTGGVHFNNPWSCLLVGNILLFSVGCFTAYYPIPNNLYVYTATAISFGLSFLINSRHAPAQNMYFEFDSDRIQQNRKKALMLIAGCAILAFLLGALGSAPIMLAMGLAVLLQAVLLHPVSFLIVKKFGW